LSRAIEIKPTLVATRRLTTVEIIIVDSTALTNRIPAARRGVPDSHIIEDVIINAAAGCINPTKFHAHSLESEVLEFAILEAH